MTIMNLSTIIKSVFLMRDQQDHNRASYNAEFTKMTRSHVVKRC